MTKVHTETTRQQIMINVKVYSSLTTEVLFQRLVPCFGVGLAGAPSLDATRCCDCLGDAPSLDATRCCDCLGGATTAAAGAAAWGDVGQSTSAAFHGVNRPSGDDGTGAT